MASTIYTSGNKDICGPYNPNSLGSDEDRMANLRVHFRNHVEHMVHSSHHNSQSDILCDPNHIIHLARKCYPTGSRSSHCSRRATWSPPEPTFGGAGGLFSDRDRSDMVVSMLKLCSSIWQKSMVEWEPSSLSYANATPDPRLERTMHIWSKFSMLCARP